MRQRLEMAKQLYEKDAVGFFLEQFEGRWSKKGGLERNKSQKTVTDECLGQKKREERIWVTFVLKKLSTRYKTKPQGRRT